jgi:hypothetical protein
MIDAKRSNVLDSKRRSRNHVVIYFACFRVRTRSRLSIFWTKPSIRATYIRTIMRAISRDTEKQRTRECRHETRSVGIRSRRDTTWSDVCRKPLLPVSTRLSTFCAANYVRCDGENNKLHCFAVDGLGNNRASRASAQDGTRHCQGYTTAIMRMRRLTPMSVLRLQSSLSFS